MQDNDEIPRRTLPMLRSCILTLTAALTVAGTARSQTGYMVEVFNVPNTDFTSAGPINDSGDVVGFSGTLNGDGSYSYVGYLRSSAGVYTTLIPPDASGGIFAYGLNNEDNVVGVFDKADGSIDGFVYKDGSYKVVRIKDSSTLLVGINDKGAILGQFDTAPAMFVATPNGTFHFIEYPGAQSTGLVSINDRGAIVGSYVDATGFFVVGFALSNGVFKSLRYPGSLNTQLTASNNAGAIAGYSQLNSGYYKGFVYSAQKFTDFTISGALNTFVEGINNTGQLSGNFIDSSNVQHGFIATPVPE